MAQYKLPMSSKQNIQHGERISVLPYFLQIGFHVPPTSYIPHYCLGMCVSMHTYKIITEVDSVTFGCFIVGATRMMFGFMRNMKRNILIVEVFVLFFLVEPETNSGSQTIFVIKDRRAE